MERLCEVVVGPEAETANALRRRSRGGEHEHHCGVVTLGHHPANGVAVHHGEVAVQDDHVEVVEVELDCCLYAVMGDIDGHALVLQPFDEGVG
jgi:hypothetical protein